jgi:hypothetical protein
MPVAVDAVLLFTGQPQTVTPYGADGSRAWTYTSPNAAPVVVRVLDKGTVAIVSRVQSPGSAR